MKRLVCGLVASLILLILFSVPVWAEDKQKAEMVFSEQMTFQELADANNIKTALLLKKLGLDEKEASLRIGDLAASQSLSIEQVRDTANKLFVEAQVEKSKNWMLIFSKFFLWVVLVAGMSFVIRTKKTVKYKSAILLAAMVVFGVILGSDPNPLGVVKDGIVLYADEGVLFKPRFVALGFLLLLVLVFSRIFCGWACQIGTAQELIYRNPVRKIKLPFFVTNFVRVLVFGAIFVFSFGFHQDILGYIDPFKIYSFDAAAYTPWLVSFIVLLAVSSIVVYRPWCTFACPFGLLAWAVNKLSFQRRRFDPTACSECDVCSGVCPTGAAVEVKKGSTAKDCFMCNRCQEACPTGAMSYGTKNSRQRWPDYSENGKAKIRP